MPDWLDFDPWPEIFPGTIELVAAADTIDLPLIAGASPGLFDDLTGWFGGIAESSVQPVLDFLAGKISDLIRNVWAGVEGGLNVLARLQYRGVFGAFGWTIPDPPRTAYAQYADNRFFTSGQLLALSFQVLFYLWVRIRDDGLNWVRDRVNDGLGWGKDRLGRPRLRLARLYGPGRPPDSPPRRRPQLGQGPPLGRPGIRLARLHGHGWPPDPPPRRRPQLDPRPRERRPRLRRPRLH